MQFRSISDLRRTILANLHRVPADVDVIVGVPRSGMLPASIVALDRNLPMADLENFAQGRLLATGSTRKVAQTSKPFEAMKHALIIDDSISSGGSLTKARAVLQSLSGTMKLTFAAVYGVQPVHDAAEIIFETVDHPRAFEWNVMHHWVLSQACLDIDGVLCHDPKPHENDDGDAYMNFLRTARPLSIPSVPVNTLVTSRLERYRPETEEWLRAQGVQYERLIMLDVASAEERRRLGLHGKFKGKFYRESDHSLFIESELHQAETIAEMSGKPVLSIEGMIMCYPGIPTLAIIKAKARRRLTRFMIRGGRVLAG